MTFCPLKRSSMYPVTFPIASCCATKYRPHRPAKVLLTKSMRTIMAAARTERGTLIPIITADMAMMVTKEDNTMGRAWLIICLRVSISLV